jgi:hypothetical protein
MYPKVQQPKPEAMTRRDKRGLAVAAAVILAVIAGVAIWAAVRPGSYGQSRDGCVTVTSPSSTGGGLQHACGAAAVAMCRNAYAHNDRLSLLTRPQCRLAGILPPPPGAVPSSGQGG